ncbi:MAG: hypothetical protein AAF719_03820 [Pseudomonadota bacterium]
MDTRDSADSTGVWRRIRKSLAAYGLGGFALAGFFCVSVVATGLGFADLRAANTDAAHLSIIELGFVGAVTLFVVSAMVAALNAALDTTRGAAMRATAFVFYVFFAFWSVGFGFGFFWKELAGQEFTETQFERSISNAAAGVADASDALAVVETSVVRAADLARARAELEAEEGGTCANRPASPPGDGPLTRSRFAFADRAQALAEDVARNWTGRLEPQRLVLERRVAALSSGTPLPEGADSEEAALLADLAAAKRLSSVDRELLFTQTYDDVRSFIASANALRARNGDAFADQLDALSSEVGADPQRRGRADPERLDDPSYCWDVVLSDRLLAAAASLRALEDIAAPTFEFLEGPKATRAAFFNLARWVGGVWRAGSQDFGEKEFVALFASLAVDLGILILTLLRAPRRLQLSALARAEISADTERDAAERLAGLASDRVRQLLDDHILQDGRRRYLAFEAPEHAGPARIQGAKALRNLALFIADKPGVKRVDTPIALLWPSLRRRLAASLKITANRRGLQVYRLSPEAEMALKLLFKAGGAAPDKPPSPEPLRFETLAD